MLLALALVAGCAWTNQGSSNNLAQEAAEERALSDAWANAPVGDVELHPYFSTIRRQTTALSSGGELWDYAQCATARQSQVCNMIGGTMVCRDATPTTGCCHRQFVVKEGAVAAYRQVGACLTGCTYRPASRPCVAGAP